jgi:hypothetical protein
MYYIIDFRSLKIKEGESVSNFSKRFNKMYNKIPLKEEAKPFRRKLRQINIMLLPIMEMEVKKFLDAQIIVPLIYSEWVANLVPVRKKIGETDSVSISGT